MDDILTRVQTALRERYRVERELGRGGMATVYLAEDLKHHRPVAIKVLRPELSQALGPSRFLREIEIAAALNHPGILPLYDSGQADGLLYYVMPYIEGESLRDRLNRGRQLTMEETLRIARGVIEALAHAHSRGVVHRDIKPENILLHAGHSVVSDFGVARAVSEAGGTTLTETGFAIGTPSYMSPEQALGDSDVDARTDLYAIGVVAYEVLAGQPPFVRASSRQVIAAHISEAPRAISELRPEVPKPFAEVVMRCLEKDPERRPQSAGVILTALESVTRGELAESARVDTLRGSRAILRRALAIYSAALVVVAAAAWIAMIAMGLPDWVFRGALLIMAAGLPAIFLTAYVHYSAHRTPTRLAPYRRPRPQAIKRLVLLVRPYATWRRTTVAGAAAMGAFALGVGGFMTLRALGIGPVGTLLAAGRLAPNARLLVADFKVAGLDPGVGHALAEAARTALAESRKVSVVRVSEVVDALRRMQRSAAEPLDLVLARELAVREGIPGIVHGEITPLGTGFLVGLQLIGADSGNTLASFHETADAPRDLLHAVDKLARQLRSKIGESLKSVRASPPLERVTTSSLDALQKHTEGMRAIVAGDPAKAARLQEEAVAIDPGFAMAWRALAAAWGSAGFGVARADSGAAMAFKYRERLTERERAAVEAYYYLTVGRDRAKAARAHEAMWERYSEPGNLGLIYMERREFARAESLYRWSLARDPGAAITYTNLVTALANQGKIAQAESTLARAVARFGPRAEQTAMLLFMKGQLDAYGRVLDSLHRSSDLRTRYAAVEKLSAFEILRGRIADYERYREESRRLRATIGLPLRPNDFYSSYAALVDVEVRRQPASALRRLDSAFVSVKHQGVLHAARAYALAGRPDRGQALMERLLSAPIDSANRRAGRPFAENVWATIALAEGRPREAITRYRKSDSLPDGPAHGCAICPLYDLGTAFEAAGEADSAIAMFEAYVRTPSTDRQDTRGWPHAVSTPHRLPLVHERLGKLYEGKGNRSRASYHYRRFVDLWKNADPELQPRVAAARNRIAALQGAANAGRE
jgi:tetratricopeptide (TPR) repeat protein/predicted Ser/Thr protein kinase